MRKRALLVRRLAVPLLGLSLVLGQPDLPRAAAAAAAPSPAVAVGEIVVALDGVAPNAAPELRRVVRALLTDELTRLSQRGVVIVQPLVVSATLTKLSSEQEEQRTTASAAISLALRRADDQVLFAELRGRASAEERAGSLASVRSAALRAAVQGAVRRLPEAIQRSR